MFVSSLPPTNVYAVYLNKQGHCFVYKLFTCSVFADKRKCNVFVQCKKKMKKDLFICAQALHTFAIRICLLCEKLIAHIDWHFKISPQADG